jgi:hypothetical protein
MIDDVSIDRRIIDERFMRPTSIQRITVDSWRSDQMNGAMNTRLAR